MAQRLADRLSRARESQFVGRMAELALFRSALTAPDPPFYVLYLYGPGGVGKTTLVRRFVALCEELGVMPIYIDARDVEPAPEAFLGALRVALGADAAVSPIHLLAERDGRQVILIDTSEVLLPIDYWLSNVFLPQLTDNTMIVLAGRHQPSPAWYADPGWRSLIRVVPLRNLSPDESSAFLGKRGIPEDQVGRVLEFTHGHPLALSLVADVFAQRQGIYFDPEAAPDVIHALLQQLVRRVPGPAYRAALEACALVRIMTEPLLATMLGLPDAHDLFDWLRGLSLIEAGPEGLFPHDLAREALVTDLRWRNPDWYNELHRRARVYYMDHLNQVQGIDQQRMIWDYIFLHRDNAIVRPFFEWQGGGGGIVVEGRQPGDAPIVHDLVALHEGDVSGQLAAHWLSRQPEGAVMFRDTGLAGTPGLAGLLLTVALHQATPEDATIDPAIGPALAHVQQHTPLRPGETATYFRFWMARDGYQAVSPVQSLVFVQTVRHYLTTPGLVYTFFVTADPDFWTGVFAYAELARLPELDFEVDGRRYGVYGHNWRAMPPLVWLNLLAERETAMMAAQPATPPAVVAPIVVLSEDEFGGAVRTALRSITRPAELHHNPLLQSRLVTDRAGMKASTVERIAVLQALVKDAAEPLQATPRDVKFYRVLYHTYFHPAPTQEQAAELLDVPFSTYRRHLKTAVERLTATLWLREVGTLGPA